MNFKKLFGKNFLMFLTILFVVSLIIYFIKNSDKSSEFFDNMNDISMVATCPSGYRQYIDKPGNNVCCSGKIDYIGSTCEGKTCTLHTNIENPNKPGNFYEKCKSK